MDNFELLLVDCSRLSVICACSISLYQSERGVIWINTRQAGFKVIHVCLDGPFREVSTVSV